MENAEENLEKRGYELAFLVSEESAAERISRLMGQHQIEIMGQGPIKKINLAYEVGGKNQAFFGYLTLKALPQEIKSFEHDLSTSQFTLRHFIVSLPARKVAIAMEPPRRKPMTAPKPKIVRPPRPLSNVDLEKKLEEILQ